MPTHVAIIEKNDMSERRAVIVPPGSDLGYAGRQWLHPYFGHDWHLVEFIEIAKPTMD